MEKVLRAALAIPLLISLSLIPTSASRAAAPARVPAASCAGSGISSPMPGHYTGPWHSDGDYHFAVFNTDLELQITIDGTLDVTIDPNGQVSGTANGHLQAPIYDYGRRDVSSGFGDISGPVSGLITSSGSLLVLNQPVIDMHWGTFGGGGSTTSTIERFICMPDYQLPASSFDCISAKGTIAEKDFPVQWIIRDGVGDQVQAPGIGGATGAWQLTSDQAGAYGTLSQQVDAFISQSNSVLNDSAQRLTPEIVNRQIVQPLKSLEAQIKQNPDVSRCLLLRLTAWEASVLPGLFQKALQLAVSSDLASLRQADDLLRATALLNADCGINDGGADSALLGHEKSLLDHAVAVRDWLLVSLLSREMLLHQGERGAKALQVELQADIHALLASKLDKASLLDAGRVAYAIGDDVDASAVAKRLGGTVQKAVVKTPGKGKGKGRKPLVKPRAKPTKTAKPKPKPKPTPTATRKPAPKTVAQLLARGAVNMSVQTSGSPATFSWKAVPGATHYAVLVGSPAGPTVIWAWSGSGTSASFGDTALEGVAGSSGETWPSAIGRSGHTWSVVALNDSGKIIGLKFRTKI